MHTAVIFGSIVASYLIGAIPFSFLFAKGKGVDLRAAGSGNVGATNVFRTVGRGWGVAALAADMAKGFLPAWGIPRWIGSMGAPVDVGLLCGMAAVVGHTWPIYLRFRGGKGVATSAGALLGISPMVIGIGAAFWLGIFLISGYVSLASVGAAAAVAVGGWAFYHDVSPVLTVALVLLGLLVMVRHRGNIGRLWAGTERRALWGKPANASERQA